MPTPREPSPKVPADRRPGVEEAEAVLVEHYGRLVRLAHLVLPPALGRHRRVVTAHTVVQDALPRTPAAPRPHDGDAAGDGYVWIRERVLRTALRHERRRRARPYPRLPVVLGLRLSPHAGGAGELALSRALAGVPATARAALALRLLEGLADDETAAVLAAAGVADPAAAQAAAAGLPGLSDGSARALLAADEFDPSRVQLHPTDLLRRRHRARAAATAAVALLFAASTLTAALITSDRERTADDAKPAAPAQPAGSSYRSDPADLRSAPAGKWADTTRLDLTAWPARGARRGDRALLGRALRAWAGSGEAKVTTSPGTPAAAPTSPPQLLYAADVDGHAVVLLLDAATDRVARYTEPSAGARPALAVARSDDAGVTTAAALVLTRDPGRARYLLAPWIAESGTRDLLRPAERTRPLTPVDGVTPPVPVPSDGGSCASWPVLSLRSSELIVEKHAFLVTDLGELAPAHLTHTPSPDTGAPSRQPREVTGRTALESWARSACLLADLRGDGVRAVNDWVYARQTLPDGAGTATWVCTRADTWRGPGGVRGQLQAPAAPGPPRPGTVVAEREDTAACSRFGQHVVAGARWRSPDGQWYALAAGSRHIVRIRLTGGVSAQAPGPVAAVRAAPATPVRITAVQSDGATLAPLS
ncbi:hypothetical protein [Streptomyces sp. ODS05-4]|uniref:hypothetical protein n=1 Tax=Streptomyces sp. ODS05-4 TaxID=2944939 RepID=UPI00210EE9CB|nr:hypothetical protein [Streptomyces sp. ODS05-4]